MNLLDSKIIEGLHVIKDDFGVSYTHIANRLGVTVTAITRFKNGETSALGYDSKIELLKILNEYLDNLITK